MKKKIEKIVKGRIEAFTWDDGVLCYPDCVETMVNDLFKLFTSLLKKERKRIKKALEKARLDCKTCGDWNERLDNILKELKGR